MTCVWKPREDGINFREPAHGHNTCGAMATGDYTCTRPKGHAGWHVASGIDGAYEVWPDGVFVPVPDGVTYDDALRAVQDARPWVRWDRERFGGFPEGKRLRVEFRAGVTDSSEHYVHPDDVPDPDAEVRRKVKGVLSQTHLSIDTLVDAVLAVVREDGAR